MADKISLRSEADTWKAVNDYCSPKVSPLIPVAVSGVAIGGVFLVVRGKGMKA